MQEQIHSPPPSRRFSTDLECVYFWKAISTPVQDNVSNNEHSDKLEIFLPVVWILDSWYLNRIHSGMRLQAVWVILRLCWYHKRGTKCRTKSILLEVFKHLMTAYRILTGIFKYEAGWDVAGLEWIMEFERGHAMNCVFMENQTIHIVVFWDMTLFRMVCFRDTCCLHLQGSRLCWNDNHHLYFKSYRNIKQLHGFTPTRKNIFAYPHQIWMALYMQTYSCVLR